MTTEQQITDAAAKAEEDKTIEAPAEDFEGAWGETEPKPEPKVELAPPADVPKEAESGPIARAVAAERAAFRDAFAEHEPKKD